MNESTVKLIITICTVALLIVGFLLYPVINPCKEIQPDDIKKYTNEVKDRIVNANDSTLDALSDSFISSHR